MTATAQQLEQAILNLPSKDQDFGKSLLQGFNRFGRFTPGQQKWVDILVDRANGKGQQDVQLEGTMNAMGAMIRLFQAGHTKLKYPKVRISTESGRTLYLTLAGERSKYSGNIMVNDQDVYDDAPWGRARRWYGRIDKDGVFHASAKNDQDVTDALHKFAADPVQAATAYGSMTGHCCFCAKKLTDERSVQVGYGKTCAGNYGLPWGEK